MKEALKFEKMLEDHKRPLFPSCKPEQKKLRTTLEMLNGRQLMVSPTRDLVSY